MWTIFYFVVILLSLILADVISNVHNINDDKIMIYIYIFVLYKLLFLLQLNCRRSNTNRFISVNYVNKIESNV